VGDVSDGFFLEPPGSRTTDLTPEATTEDVANTQPSLKTTLGELAGRTSGELGRFAQRQYHMLGGGGGVGPWLSAQEANERYGLKGEDAFTHEIPEYTARSIVEAKQERQRSDTVLGRWMNAPAAAPGTTWLANGAVSLIGGMLDPVELSAMAVPGLGEERIFGKALAAGWSARKAAIMAKLGAGGSAGLAAGAVLAPLHAGLAADEEREYGMRDAMGEMFSSAIGGAGIHAGLGPALGWGFSAARGEKWSYIGDLMRPVGETTPEMLHAIISSGVHKGYLQSIIDAEPETHRAWMAGTISQLMDGRKPDASSLIPDLSPQARAIDPDAQEEHDRLTLEKAELERRDPAHVALEQRLQGEVDALVGGVDVHVRPELTGDDDALYNFGYANAKEAPHGAAQAALMEVAGVSREAIWQTTGWFKTPTNEWAFDIDVSNSELKTDVFNVTKNTDGVRSAFRGRLGDVLDSSALYKHYPEIRDVDTIIRVGPDYDPGGRGYFLEEGGALRINVEATDSAGALETLIHEIQHMLYRTGDRPSQKKAKYSYYGYKHISRTRFYKEALAKSIENLRSYLSNTGLAKDEVEDHISHNMDGIKRDVEYFLYYLDPEEIEARSAEERTHFSQEERRNIPPFPTEHTLKSDYERGPEGVVRDVNAAIREAVMETLGIKPKDVSVMGERMYALRGVHSTDADIQTIDPAKFGQTYDAGYWGRGFYMFPYEYAKGMGDLYYGAPKEGARNYLMSLDSKKPFVITKKSGGGYDADWASLAGHGWPHEKPPIMAWEDADVMREAKQRALSRDSSDIRDAEGRLRDAVNAVYEAEDAGASESHVKKLEAESGRLRADVNRLRRTSSPEHIVSQDFTDALLKAGYDGVIIKDENGVPYEMVGIKPGTLKTTFGGERMYALRGFYRPEMRDAVMGEGQALALRSGEGGETAHIEGYSDPKSRSVWISAAALDPSYIARHEAGHMIRASGLFKPEEWRLLTEHAQEAGWIDALPEREHYERAYGHHGEAGLRDRLAEEAIMHKFAAWSRGEAPEIEAGSWIAQLFERLKALLERTGNWLRGQGFNSADDVARLYGYDSAEAIFRAMDEGQMRQRQIERGDQLTPPRNRLDAINDRLRELSPRLDDAYKQAQASNPLDPRAVAAREAARRQMGEASGMTDADLAETMRMYDAKPASEKAETLDHGQWPEELLLAEQRHLAAVQEGAALNAVTAEELALTQTALQNAANREQGYLQAVECLLGGRQ